MATTDEMEHNLETILKPYIEYRKKAGLGDDDNNEGDNGDDHDDDDDMITVRLGIKPPL